MLYGSVPFKSPQMKELHKSILEGKYTLKDDVSSESRDLIRHLLEVSQKIRYSFNDIIKHEWFNEFDSSSNILLVQIFMKSEKALIYSEFSRKVKEGRNNNETENTFTEQSIDKTINDLTKNISTKSVILAPFNSTETNLENESPEDCDFLDKKLIHLGQNVREIDRQYEKNNNGEMDNGVYNMNEENSSNEKYNCIENFEESNLYPKVKNLNNSNSNSQNKVSKFTFCKFQISNYSKRVLISIVYLDEDIVKDVEECGFPRDYIIKSLETKERNHATATYYLLKSNNEF